MVPYDNMSVLRVCCFCPVMGIQILVQRSGRGLKVPLQHTHAHTYILDRGQAMLGVRVLLRF